MRVHGWLLVVAIAAAPGVARADASLGPARRILGHGVALVVQGDYADGEKLLRESLRLEAGLPEAHYNLGVALKHLGRYDEAIAEYDQAEQMYAPADEPNRAKALYGAALAKEARGDRNAWNAYLAFARPLRAEQPSVRIAEQRQQLLAGIRVPGTQKASR
jgi:tetratricopeptide (TPR) repeat protein